MRKSLKSLRFSLLIAGCLLCLGFVLAGPATADVTLVNQIENTGMAAAGNGESTVYIKGLKMRTEQQIKGDKVISILDVENQKMIQLDAKKKQAEVFDLSKVAAQMQQIGASDVKISVTPTGAKENVLGGSCDQYDMKVVVSVDMGGAGGAGGMDMSADVVIKGTACMVKGAPGAQDYERFYNAMAEKGMFFGDPRAAEAQPGQQKGMTELYRQMAEKGVAYHSDLNIGFEGSGMMAKMMSKMSFDTETTVKSVSTDTLSDDLFTVPSGWKVKNAN